MKQLFIMITFVLSLTTNVMSQSNSAYQGMISQFFNSSQMVNKMPMSTQFGMAMLALSPQFLTSIGPELNQKSDLLDKYVHNQLDKDVIEVITPYFEAEIPLEELQQLYSQLEADDVTLAMKKVENASVDSTFIGTFTLQIVYSLFGLALGIEPAPVSIPAECPQKYVDKVSEYMQTTNDNNVLSIIFNMLKNSQKEGEESLSKVSEFISKNATNIMVNAYWGKVSEDDLDLLLNVSKSPTYQKMSSVITNLISNGNNITMQLRDKYKVWSAKQ